ncbi:DUF4260 family protein [Methylobacterium sp. P1-11]|uniref:DUF4260 domain-containing protein n=1 Tax=Methylobacterium sp. P1-11 TaxID=2024616 RepID=UPI0011F061BA|nr:DUF4260 domain-containing protein [Methylobacterium sp. P1-11]KAA0112689.1 DUF4260 family protein [Methylobacterium sp. P1-11]
MSGRSVEGWPRMLLRLEGACILAAALWAYGWLGQSWWLFAALLFAPDLSMLGYAAGPVAGAVLYNLMHTLALPLIGLSLAAGFDRTDLAGLALIWLAHIGLDRALGYGLKYASGFGDTHLGVIGRADDTTIAPH